MILSRSESGTSVTCSRGGGTYGVVVATVSGFCAIPAFSASAAGGTAEALAAVEVAINGTCVSALVAVSEVTVGETSVNDIAGREAIGAESTAESERTGGVVVCGAIATLMGSSSIFRKTAKHNAQHN